MPAHVYVKDADEATLPTEAHFGFLWRAYQEHGFGELTLASSLRPAHARLNALRSVDKPQDG